MGTPLRRAMEVVVACCEAVAARATRDEVIELLGAPRAVEGGTHFCGVVDGWSDVQFHVTDAQTVDLIVLVAGGDLLLLER